MGSDGNRAGFKLGKNTVRFASGERGGWALERRVGLPSVDLLSSA